MRVRVLYFEGCPNHEPTLALVREVMEELGLDVPIETVEVNDPGAAETLRFFGSPTIQVNGLDIEPAARTRSEYAYSCRMYGASGTPPRDLVRAALEEGRAA